MFAGVFAVILNFQILQPSYRSIAQILVDQPPRVLMVSEKNPNMSPQFSVETHMKMIKTMNTSREAAKLLKEPERAASGLLGAVTVRNVEDTGLIQIIVEGADSKRCADVANAFAEAFVKLTKRLSRRSIEEATEFIEEQLSIADTDLKNAERKIFEFNQANGIYSLDEEASQRNLNIANFEIARVNTEIAIHGIRAQLQSIQNMLDDKTYIIYTDPDAFMGNEWITDIQKNLLDIESDRATLLLKYKPDHPKIKDMDKRIKQLEGELEKAISNIVSRKTVLASELFDDRNRIFMLNTELLMRQSSLDITNEILVRMKNDQAGYPALKYEYSSLTRERDIAEKLYLLLYEKRQQAHIDEVQREVNVRVFEKAAAAKDPFKPERKKNIAIILVLGLFLGIGLAFILEEMEETIHTSDDVKTYLNLPVLGTIPYSSETINKLITEVPLKSPIAEAYRRLSFFTQLFCLDPPIKSLLITSSKSDEGKSTTLANLSISIAQEGTKVLIIDTDLRRPMLHRMFNVDNSLGLSSILSGELEAELAVSDLSVSGHLPRDSFMEIVVDRMIQPLAIKGLSIIPSGPLPANSIELLRSERMLEFLRVAEKKADIVIFDSPPSIHVIDAVVLAQILDGVMFVINAGRISKDEALQVKYMIESTKTPIIGVALNNIEVTSPDYYYYYYYGGYGYGTRQRRKRVKLKR